MALSVMVMCSGQTVVLFLEGLGAAFGVKRMHVKRRVPARMDSDSSLRVYSSKVGLEKVFRPRFPGSVFAITQY